MFKLWRLGSNSKDKKEQRIVGELSSKQIEEVLGRSSDLLIKDIYTWNENIVIKTVGIEGMVDSNAVSEFIIKPLTVGMPFKEVKAEKDAYEIVKKGFVYNFSQLEVTTLAQAIDSILQGVTVVVFDNIKKAIAFDVKKIPQRGIESSEDESVLKGAKDAFIENIRINTALIRKKIKSPNIRFEKFEAGDETNTCINIVYYNSTVDLDVLNKVRERIINLDVANLLSAENFESNIKDNKYSIFPQVQYTERVDKFCANIVDGKVGVLIDGLPVAYIIPGVFPMFFQAPEDYSGNYVVSSAIRLLRYLCFGLSIILPAFYVAITTFHHEMVPTNLLISIIESKEGVPFASFFEVLGLLLAFELLLEASIRLPKTIGATISIIGALIVGEAAVNAKFISPAVLVVIAITGVAGFVIPNQSLSNATRICRMIMVLAAGISGLFGISFVILIILAYLCKLETFGVPYLTPFVGNDGKNIWKDTLVRLPRDVGK